MAQRGMVYDNSFVAIVPAAVRTRANKLFEAMRWGPNNFSIPLSATGKNPATHYAFHAWETDNFFADMADIVSTGWPEKWDTRPEALGLIRALIASMPRRAVKDVFPQTNFDDAINEQNLQRVVVDIP